MTLTLIIVLIGFFAVYRSWPDICAHIVNTGLAEERREKTPVERVREQLANPAASDPNAAAAALINAAVNAKK